jgi:hypothetical protein
MTLTEQITTTSPAGRMMLQMLGAFAEFERSTWRRARPEGRERQSDLRIKGHVAGYTSILNVPKLTIGRVAAAAGVNVETIRYYQRRRLLEEPAKPSGGNGSDSINGRSHLDLSWRT